MFLLKRRADARKGARMSELETAAIAFPLVLIADPDSNSRERRAAQLAQRGFRVAFARTPFEAIVKASCHLPDLILIAASLGVDGASETAELLSTCPATAHIPIVQLRGRRLPSRVFAYAAAS